MRTHCLFGNISNFTLIATLLLLLGGHFANAQCPGFPSIAVDADCADYTTLGNNQNINSGTSFGACDSATATYNNVNLNGGTVRVCGNVNLSGNFNSGTLVIACGSTLQFPSNVTLNNDVRIINYGTVRVGGNLVFQNQNNLFANESTDAQLFVSGNVQFAQNTNQTGYLKNNGYIRVSGALNGRKGANICLGPGSVIECHDFVYQSNCGGPDNRVSYTSGTDSAVVRVNNSAKLRAQVTNDNNIQLWLANGVSIDSSSCGAVGTANVVTNAKTINTPAKADPATCAVENCYSRAVVLPVELIYFEAQQQQRHVVLRWQTASETNCKQFEVQRSANAKNWHTVAIEPGNGTTSQPSNYSARDNEAGAGIVYYRLLQEDFDGTVHTYNTVALRLAAKNSQQLALYPNPTNNRVTVETEHDRPPVLFDALGNLVSAPSQRLSATSWQLELSAVPTGWYVVQAGNSRARLCRQ